MTLDGLELVNISISEHSKLIEFAKLTILLGPSLVQMTPLRLGLWMSSMQLGSRLLVRLGLQRSWSGPRILLRKSWSNTTFQQQPMAHFQISEAAKVYIEEKGAPIVVKADGLALGKRCRRCGDS